MQAWIKWDEYCKWYKEEVSRNETEPIFDKDKSIKIVTEVGDDCHVVQYDVGDTGLNTAAAIPRRFISLEFQDNIIGT